MFSLLSKNPSDQNKNNDHQSMNTILTDLNIDQILKRISAEWDKDLMDMYYSFPLTREDEDYRRDIYHDIKMDDVFTAFLEYHGKIRERKNYSGRKDDAYELIQKQTWYLREIYTYVSSLDALKEKLDKCTISSEGLKTFISYLNDHLSGDEFSSLRTDAVSLWKELSDFHVVLTYEKGRFTLTNGTTERAYDKFLSELFPGEEHEMINPFAGTEYFSNLEEEIIKLFQRKNKNFFKKLDKFCKDFPQVSDDQITLFEKEMIYYLAFARFQRSMSDKGYEMCTPQKSDKKLKASGLYDLALALTNMDSGKETIPNELFMDEDENFFVLTGPNQGGKTTYGRSLGQLVYFTKMGFDVPAISASVPYYTNLWTHFSVEESIESGRGKLMDELERLKPIMHESQEGAFVVINELFTTAANYDAIEMGKRVLKYLIDKKCKGIYVTHLWELSQNSRNIVSLRATVDKDNIQTFRIERSEPVESNCINRQVVKYGLTYDQLKERFS